MNDIATVLFAIAIAEFFVVFSIFSFIWLDEYRTRRHYKNKKPMTDEEFEYARKHDKTSIYYYEHMEGNNE